MALPSFARAAERETHGLSAFGELNEAPDFKHFAYVNPDSPKGGRLVLQLTSTNGNQNFETFDTFNIYVLKGDGAAGMDLCFDSLMAGSADEPDALYGLVARAVRVSDDKLTYRFLLRPEARFSDGSKLTARDVAFSLNILKTKGHPLYRQILDEMTSAEAEADDVVKVVLSPARSPVNVGQNNFDTIRYEYFRERQVAFEAFKNGTITYHEEFTSRIWATGYDFPAIKDGRVKKEALPSGVPATIQGWLYNLRRDTFHDPRIREALGLVFDFEWTNKNIMYSSATRTASYFEGTPMMAKGKPSREELALLEPYRGKVPDEVFGEPYIPPVSDGSGADRTLLKKANDMLLAAGCMRDGSVLKLPNGKPFEIEFLDSSGALQPHTQPFQQNLSRLGIKGTTRLVDAAQYQARIKQFDFDIITLNRSGSLTPGDGLRQIYGSAAAKTQGGLNVSGISDPAVDALVDIIAKAQTRAELNVAAMALDRVLRAGHYWIPMWHRDQAWIAYWDQYSRPEKTPKFGTGAPGTWWFDATKAKKIGRG
eukprot:gene7030-7094_t